ncbi:hypothetical protein VB620_00535 [Nodularia harveyana UHCC-0300]|uniref:Transmembrane protein n=1 Tax=Nodularia harveyana UHCC-0300 TaxID=2974287 RepID=A0ABU5U8H6_9CYAN|nr:hypothetical protein [Nodularia harveyana]MEA5579824.1 hypothetical protein [Nodularia harveyana UHCC-0300]
MVRKSVMQIETSKWAERKLINKGRHCSLVRISGVFTFRNLVWFFPAYLLHIGLSFVADGCNVK